MWVIRFDNGKLNFKGSFTDGRAQGKHKYYWRNGALKLVGKYKFGLKDGNWKSFDENANLTLTIRYKRGEEIKINGVKIKPEGAAPDDLDDEEY